MAVRYGTLVRYGTPSIFAKEVRCTDTVSFFCDGTGTVRFFCNGTGTVRRFAV